MHTVVKIITRDDGEKVDNQVWCLSHVIAGGNATFCTGEYYGFGESSCEFKEKEVQKAGITCNDCLAKIKIIKSIKL